MALLTAIPQGIYICTGNGQVCLNWNLVAGATSYSVQRSPDQVTWVEVGTPTATTYLDTAVNLGTQYWYQIASVSGSGPSGYNPTGTNGLPLSAIPSAPGQVPLQYLRYQAKLRSDQLVSNFCTIDEWNLMINQSNTELYDVLVAKFGEDYFMAPQLILTSSGQQSYPLPDGTNYITNGVPAPACYKVISCDLNAYGASLSSSQGWRSMSRFNWADRNKFNYLLGAASNNVVGQYCQFQYREMGTQLFVLPVNTGQYFRLSYVPLTPQLLQDTDILPFSYSGWHEYIVVDVAAKALAKQEFFEQAEELLQRKAALLERIETTAANRDVGQPNTATNSRAMLGDPNFGGGNGFGWGTGGGMGLLGTGLGLPQMESQWSAILNPIVSSPIATPILLSNYVLSTGTNVINHTLGKSLRGYIVVLNSASATFWDSQSTNPAPDKTLILNSSGPTTVSILVF